MKWQGEELVRVRSESELRAGMLVVVSVCFRCGRSHGYLLLRRSPIEACNHGGDGFLAGHFGWESLPARCGFQAGKICLPLSIAQGRLYRLRDEEQHDEQTRTRELERTR